MLDAGGRSGTLTGMSATLTSTPAADGYRMPAEWDDHAGCFLVWPERTDNWRDGGYPYKNLMLRRNYEQQKYRLQVELLKLQAWVKATGQRVVILFEGRDAAGKGGAIKRFTEHLNPRGARVVALEKPSDTERGQWYGEKMSLFGPHPNGLGPVIVRASQETERDDAGFIRQSPTVEAYDQPKWWQTEMLPEPLRHDSGHDGSHTFLTHEFIDALQNDRAPAIDIREALAMTVPGIIAHASALAGGKQMEIPTFFDRCV